MKPSEEEILWIGSSLSRIEEFLMSEKSKEILSKTENLAPAPDFKDVFHTVFMMGYSCGEEDQKVKTEFWQKKTQEARERIKELEKTIIEDREMRG